VIGFAVGAGLQEEWLGDLKGNGPVLVTGAAGFVGCHLALRLLEAGVSVIGIDNLSPYYDLRLKHDRIALLEGREGFHFERLDISDAEAVAALFRAHRPKRVAHMAAQAGVRHSIDNPLAYGPANLTGFLAILEACRTHGVEYLLYASSSSVYGGNALLPYSTTASVDHPVSLYAATKKANELMAHAYSHLYGIPATGLRFFTVYGPWGRPDMAYWKFTEAIAAGRAIDVYNHGRMSRDFTYIDDIVDAVVALLARPPTADPGFDRLNPDPSRSWAPHVVYNIGARHPENLLDMISALERLIGRKAELNMLPMQPGDVERTAADVAPLEAAVGFRPSVRLDDGLERFVGWWMDWSGMRGGA
jgi:UDP-glucuronate 4-epimerase